MKKVVVAALIVREGLLLACRRRHDQDHAGKWEFPGGKVEPGELEAAALRRELDEELRIDAMIGALIDRYEFAYPSKAPIELAFYAVREYSGALDGGFFDEIRWAALAELPALDFLEGDAEFVRRLAAGAYDAALR